MDYATSSRCVFRLPNSNRGGKYCVVFSATNIASSGGRHIQLSCTSVLSVLATAVRFL